MKTFFLFALMMGAALASVAQPADIIYVGTYSTRGSKGIYAFSFNRVTGDLRPLSPAVNSKSPSFLALHPNGQYLYSADEANDAGGKGMGAISAYARDTRTGELRLLNEQPTFGQNPCHVTIDKTGRWAFVSNYSGGDLVVYALNPNGTLGAMTDSVRYVGKGPNAQRQEASHVHSSVLSADNRFLYVANLGTDKVYIYEVDAARGKLKPAQTPSVNVAPGGGPRHMTIHPNGRFAYLVQELTSSVAVFARDPQTGALQLIQDGVKALPADFTGQNTSADIHTDPSGRFLYQSNRGHNSLGIFQIGADGKLTPVGQQSVEGKTPRNFMIDKTGQYVFVANQDTDNIVVFKRDPATGKLSPTGKQVQVPAPVCLIMAP